MNYKHGFTRNVGLFLGLALVSFSLGSCNQSAPNSPSPSSFLAAAPANGHADFSNQPQFIQDAIGVQGRHGADLLAINGVIGHGVGVDEHNPNQAVILVFTNHDGVNGIPVTVEGLHTRIEMVGTITALQNRGNLHDDGSGHGGGGTGGGTTISYTAHVRGPIPAGISTGEDDICESGTIGAMVTTSGISTSPSHEASGSASDGITTYGHQYSATTPHYMLSCNHVFANENGATGATQEDQPGRYDNSCNTGNGVGALYAWNYIDPNHNNYYDVALAECDPSQTWTPAMRGGWYTPTSAYVSPTVNMSVQKVGRTTGHTTGTISGINVTITVAYSNFNATFVNQIYVRGSFIKSGDSGSMMVDNNHHPVGLNFAGGSNSSFANRMDYIAQDFGLTFATSNF